METDVEGVMEAAAEMGAAGVNASVGSPSVDGAKTTGVILLVPVAGKSDVVASMGGVGLSGL
jgi:hypothetical protein